MFCFSDIPLRSGLEVHICYGYYPKRGKPDSVCSPVLYRVPTKVVCYKIQCVSVALLYTDIRGMKLSELLYRIYTVVIVLYSLLVLLAHFHVGSDTERLFTLNCVPQKFALYVVVRHVCDEKIPNYSLSWFSKSQFSASSLTVLQNYVNVST